jgi:hypothetical protein
MRKDWKKDFNVTYSNRPYRYSLTYYISRKNLILLIALLLSCICSVYITNYNAQRYDLVAKVQLPQKSTFQSVHQLVGYRVADTARAQDYQNKMSEVLEQMSGYRYTAHALHVPVLSSVAKAFYFLSDSFNLNIPVPKNSQYDWSNSHMVFKTVILPASLSLNHVSFEAQDGQHYKINYEDAGVHKHVLAQVGEDVTLNLVSGQTAEFNVAAIDSQPGVVFYLEKNSLAKTKVRLLQDFTVKLHPAKHSLVFNMQTSSVLKDRLLLNDYSRYLASYLRDSYRQSMDEKIASLRKSMHSPVQVAASHVNAGDLAKLRQADGSRDNVELQKLQHLRSLSVGSFTAASPVSAVKMYSPWFLLQSIALVFISFFLIAFMLILIVE